MKRHKLGRHVFLAVTGFAVMCAGLCLAKLLPEAEGALRVLPYIFVGLGAGVFGGNLGAALTDRALLKNPEAARQAEIELNDERNQAIGIRAKARAYDLMLYAYAAVLLSFAVMDAGVSIILTLTALYLLFIASNIYYLNKYHKEM